ncbi:MAG: hypothetical protein PHW53_00200 [Patescibacteria group bacterium]|nr:hypothetical protein [Patescibacteria group bacterium]
MSAEDVALHSEIVQYRFEANGFLATVDLARIKRSMWDSFTMILMFFLSFFIMRIYGSSLDSEKRAVHKISTILMIITILFVIGVDVTNYFLMKNGELPFFVEHIRLMRVLGFILIMQFALVVYLLYSRMNKKWLSVALSLIVVVTPIYFFAPVIRPVVRALVPEGIRIKYNLAPVVDESNTNNFNNLYEAAIWAKSALSVSENRIFVFDDFQNEFKFKVLSRQNTNLTEKEGSIWVTSNFENAKRWYEERQAYNQIVEKAADFKEIVNFAVRLDCSYILLPRGKYMDLYYSSNSADGLEEVFSNKDYKILKI